MGIYKELVRRFSGAFEHGIEVEEFRNDSYTDITYKGHVVLRITDCDNFCVLESPILLTSDSHGHTLVLFGIDNSLLKSIVSKLDEGMHRLSVLFRVINDRFPRYKNNKSFYFKVENVVLSLTLDFSGWICNVFVSPSSTFSYIRVVYKLCKELCYCTGHEVGLIIDEGSNPEISKAFS